MITTPDVEALATAAAGGNGDLLECLSSDFLTERGWVGGVRAVLDAIKAQGFVVVRREDLDIVHDLALTSYPDIRGDDGVAALAHIDAILAAQNDPEAS